MLMIITKTLITITSLTCYNADCSRLADAIYWAEGGAKTNHPYGILAKYKTTTPNPEKLIVKK